MKGFAKDILLIDFETTGLDPVVAKPIELGAILLDKKTLAQKASFQSHIKQDLSDADPKALEITGITQSDLDGQPSEQEVIGKFVKQFGTDVFLASWNEFLDRSMLDKLLKHTNMSFYDYDYHYFDVWPVVYMHLVMSGEGDRVRLSPTLEYFGLTERGKHNALEDCRLTAKVLRKVYTSK